MTAIGLFHPAEDGFEGRIATLTLDCRLVIEPAEISEADNAPDFRILAGDEDTRFEVGAGWKRAGDKAGDYVAILIDDPTFSRPLRANLFRAEGGNHVLTWSRRRRRSSES